eukprot:GHUV01037090.1.p2 GENE.GHUV01037090.1~~GHUV01037090.1.p2  ORF type:complete len:129 (+),score=31.50 GHUV01037090.1:467-853(+)
MPPATYTQQEPCLAPFWYQLVLHLRAKTALQMPHRFPNTMQVTIEFGGSEDQPILIYNLKCFADTLAMMVTDAKGRINFATSQLAAMLGYSVNIMTEGMNITMLMQPPYSQLHSGFFKVRECALITLV